MKVVFHVSELDRLERLTANVNNILENDQNIEVAVVVNSEAIFGFDLNHYIEINNKATYYICENSLKGRSLTKDDLIPAVLTTPSSVYKIALLQSEGFLYIRV